MPDFEDHLWNTPDSQSFNNCYDYATNNRTEWRPPMPHPTPNPDDYWSVPGRTKGVTPAHARGAVSDGHAVKVLFEYTCEGVKTGVLLDGLKEPKADGSCAANCWKVAYFVRPFDPTEGGDFHFARQDSDGGWSHKQGATPVRRLTNPDPTDTTPPPEVPNVVPGYRFCGYVCCCPDTRVASLPREEGEGSGEAVMLALYEGHSGLPARISLGGEAAALMTLTDKATAGLEANWEDGIGPGTALFGIDQGSRGFVIADVSVTAFSGGAVRHISDPAGRVASMLRAPITKILGGLFIAGRAPGPILSVLAAITIGGRPLLPAGLVYTDQPDATIGGGGPLPQEGCTWTLEIKVSTATIPDPNNANCLFHVYKIVTELKKICPGKVETFGETHITQTGPHCGDPNASPPVATPQPGTRSHLKSRKTKKDGAEEVVIELPDGTTVTITTPASGAPTVELDYPNGSSGSFTLP